MLVFNQDNTSTLSFRPLSRYEWFPTEKSKTLKNDSDYMFPAPLEVWVVSYIGLFGWAIYSIGFPAPLEAWVGSYKSTLKLSMCERPRGFRPLSRYRWVPTMTFLKTTVPVLRVSGPSRGLGSFLQCLSMPMTVTSLGFRPLSRLG